MTDAKGPLPPLGNQRHSFHRTVAVTVQRLTAVRRPPRLSTPPSSTLLMQT